MTQVDRRKTDAYRNLGVDILGILGGPGNWQNSIRRAVAAIKASTGLDFGGTLVVDANPRVVTSSISGH